LYPIEIMDQAIPADLTKIEKNVGPSPRVLRVGFSGREKPMDVSIRYCVR